jgi:hypothetical protein
MGARLLGMNPAHCLVIEDAPAGIRAAHAGGMKAIGITSTYPASGLHEADAVVQKLGQIKVGDIRGGSGLAIEVEQRQLATRLQKSATQVEQLRQGWNLAFPFVVVQCLDVELRRRTARDLTVCEHGCVPL